MNEVIRVLYIHPFAAHGGATKSLAEAVAAMPVNSIRATVIAPSGAAAATLASVGMRIIQVRGVSQWDDTRFGHYRGIRWLILAREFAYWPATVIGLMRAARSGSYDMIHCNEVTALLPGLLAKRMLRLPLLVHVRSLQRGSGSGLISSFFQRLLRQHCDGIVAIDEAVRRTLSADLAVDVIHNGLAAPKQTPPITETEHFCVAVVGVLHRSKGVYEIVKAARLLRDRGVRIKLLIAGQNVHSLTGLRGWLLRRLDFARDVRADLEAYVTKHALQEVVHFAGFVSDISVVYGQAHAVCFPSLLDAPGRPVFEAALYGRPAVVAMRNPTEDVVISGHTGLCIDEPTPAKIADAIERMASDRVATRLMGERARRMALDRFDSAVSAAKILSVYRRICASISKSTEKF